MVLSFVIVFADKKKTLATIDDGVNEKAVLTLQRTAPSFTPFSI